MLDWVTLWHMQVEHHQEATSGRNRGCQRCSGHQVFLIHSALFHFDERLYCYYKNIKMTNTSVTAVTAGELRPTFGYLLCC